MGHAISTREKGNHTNRLNRPSAKPSVRMANRKPDRFNPEVIEIRLSHGPFDGTLLLALGGTFGKRLNEVEELWFFDTRWRIVQSLSKTRAVVTPRLIIPFEIDSLDMTKRHLDLLTAECRQARERRILVVMGTSRMCPTAEHIAREIPDKTIVFTGAMVPGELEHTDAHVNLGVALSHIKHLSPGVYVAMNCEVRPAGKVRKNLRTGEFQGSDEVKA